MSIKKSRGMIISSSMGRKGVIYFRRPEVKVKLKVKVEVDLIFSSGYKYQI